MITDVKIGGTSVDKVVLNGSVWWERPSPYTLLTSVYFDGTGMLELPIVLTGADTVRFKFCVYKIGNMFGWYSGSASDSNQYSFYSASSAYVRYDGTLSRGWVTSASSTVHDAVFTPTGYSDNGTSMGTYTQETFVCGGNTCLGGLPNSTSAKGQFDCYGFSIDGKCTLVPAKRNSDNTVGMYDTLNDVFYTGTFIHASAPTLMSGSQEE